MNLKQLIKEAYLKFDDCDCGKTVAPLINESKKYEAPISEALRYHVENKLPITENVFRAGSLSHITLLLETRQLFEKGIIVLNGKDKWLFENTDLGHYGDFEGKMVPLDLPLIMEEVEWPEKVMSRHNDIIFKLVKKSPDRATYELIDAKTNKIWEPGGRTYNNVDKLLQDAENTIMPQGGTKSTYLGESEKKKTPPIGKPKRGGSKKFYVYVRDKGKIKKVSFGDTTGLSAKINNPKARRAFAARHKCGTGEPKTSARYWSCRIPRYSKLLGLKSSFSGFW